MNNYKRDQLERVRGPAGNNGDCETRKIDNVLKFHFKTAVREKIAGN